MIVVEESEEVEELKWRRRKERRVERKKNMWRTKKKQMKGSGVAEMEEVEGKVEKKKTCG